MIRRQVIRRPSLILAALACSAASLHAQTAVVGQWTGVQTWPVEAIHVIMLPTGKVMLWQSWNTSTGLWDPTTGTFSTPQHPPNNYNIFCAGHAWLPDGRMLVAGGHVQNYNGENRADIYDPFTNTWANANGGPPSVPTMGSTSTTNMTLTGKRWYPSATTLGNGDILVTSGDVAQQGVTNPRVQVYQAATNTWRNLTNATRATNDLLPEYPRIFLAPDGRAINLSDKQSQTEYLDTSGPGQWSLVGQTLDPGLHNYGPAVMYDTGKIAYLGGGDPPTKRISLLDLNQPTPAWSFAPEAMAQPRRHNNATILADGTVLITGGSSSPGWNDYTGFVAQAELWNPETGEVTAMASASSIYRGYHSTALLLPDGRVLITGGNHDETSGLVEQKNAEIYSPPYLFKGARPTVTAAPDVVELGDTIFVETPERADISKALWIVPGQVTHAHNWTQRTNILDFTVTDGGINIELPATGNEAPPGYYMLFLVNSNGVPSVAEWIRAELRTVQPEVADFNGDLTVDASDLLIWQQHMGGPAGATLAEGDANDDGIVDQDDFAVWQAQYGTILSPTTAVPEPCLAAMFGSMLVSAALLRRRRAPARPKTAA